MRLRQAKKIMGWCKGDGDYYTINRHKDLCTMTLKEVYLYSLHAKI